MEKGSVKRIHNTHRIFDPNCFALKIRHVASRNIDLLKAPPPFHRARFSFLSSTLSAKVNSLPRTVRTFSTTASFYTSSSPSSSSPMGTQRRSRITSKLFPSKEDFQCIDFYFLGNAKTAAHRDRPPSDKDHRV